MSGYSTYAIGGQGTANRPAWDVKDAAGTPVTTLAGLARALRCDHDAAVKSLADVPVDALPPALAAEVKGKARPKPGGGTPPPISTGNFVSWNGGSGRVDLLVRSGKVPGVDGDVEGTDKAPAARVVVWEDGKPTKRKIAKSTHTLRRIAPLDHGKKDADPAGALVAIHADHDARCETYGRPEWRRVSAQAVKAAYDRGVRSWPGDAATTLSAAEWGLGRAEYLVKVASGEMTRPGNDVDLLHPDHPLAPTVAAPHPDSPAGRNQVVMTMAEVQADLERLLAGL